MPQFTISVCSVATARPCSPPHRCSQVSLCFPGITSASTQSAETRERAVGTELTDDRGYAESAGWTGRTGGTRSRSPRAPQSNTTKQPRRTTGAQQKAARTPDDHNTHTSHLNITNLRSNVSPSIITIHRDGTSLMTSLCNPSSEQNRVQTPHQGGFKPNSFISNLLQLPLFWTVARQLAPALISHSPKITAWTDTFSVK